MPWLFPALLAASPAPLQAQEVLWKFVQAASNEAGFGTATALDADVNGDGFADVVVGVPGRRVGARSCGAVYVYSGKDGAKLRDVTFDPTRDSNFGVCVTGLKDIDGDGCDEFAGASVVDTVVVVFSGKTGLPLLTIQPTNTPGFGAILDDAGDHDGDGLHDLIIGRTGGVEIDSSAGGARIVDLVPSGKLFSYAVSAANAGDVDADGFDDVIVGDPLAGPFDPATCGCNNSGKIYVFSGKDGSVLYDIQGGNNAYYDTTVCTTLTLSGWSTRWCFSGMWHQPSFGISVDGAGDVDGDGHADFLIGRPGLTIGWPGADDEGRAYVYSGATGALLFEMNEGGNYKSDLGAEVVGLGDVNGDGIPDQFARDPFLYSWGLGGYAFSGLNGARLYRREASLDPSSVRAGGDVNGDGRMDLAYLTTTSAKLGEVDVVAGSRLFVDSTLHEASHTYYGPITIYSGQGGAGALVLLALTEVTHAPTFFPLTLGTLDAAGTFVQYFTDPGTLPPDTYGIQAFALDANGKLLVSPIERIVLY